MPETAGDGPGPATPSRDEELRQLAEGWLLDPEIATFCTNVAKVAALAANLQTEDTWNAFATMVKTVYGASGMERPPWDQAKAFLSDTKKAVIRVLRRSSRMPGVAPVGDISQMLASESPMFVCVGLLLRFKRGRVWLDDFHCKIRTDWRCDSSDDVVPAYVLGDDEMRKIMMWMMARNIEILGHLTMRVVNDAVAYVADLDHRDALVDHIKGLPLWDRTPRLDLWLTTGMGCRVDDDSGQTAEYLRAVGRNTLIAAVARALRPGCKVDTMTIFVGAQGLLKSTALGVLGGPFYREISETPTSKDFYMQLQGCWIGEVAELASIASTKTEVNKVKAMLSRQVDTFRPPYGRETREFPRRCTLLGSANPGGSSPLRDETGNRRYAPVVCSDLSLAWVREHRDQLLAEAAYEYENGATWWEVPLDAHALATGGLQQVSVHEEALRARLRDPGLYDGTAGGPGIVRPDYTLPVEALERWGNVVQVDRAVIQWLGMGPADASRLQPEISAALVRLGWQRKHASVRTPQGPRKLWCWVPADTARRQALREAADGLVVPPSRTETPF